MLLTSESWSESDPSKMRLAAPFQGWRLVAATPEAAAFLIHTNQYSVDGQQLRSYMASAAPVLAELVAEATDSDDWDVFMWWRGVVERVTEFWVYRARVQYEGPIYGYVGIRTLSPVPPWQHLVEADDEATLIARFRGAPAQAPA